MDKNNGIQYIYIKKNVNGILEIVSMLILYFKMKYSPTLMCIVEANFFINND